MKRKIVKMPKPKDNILQKILSKNYWDKEALMRLKRNLVVHSKVS